MFYVYEWYIIETDEIIYVGKGSKKEYLTKRHNKIFRDFILRYKCSSRIIKEFENEQEAYKYEFNRINELKAKNQCICNIRLGGNGGGASMTHKMNRWNDQARLKASKYNVMKSEEQRNRMRNNNPMKIKEYALKNGKSRKRPVLINNKEYEGVIDVAKEYKVTDTSVIQWLKRGYTNKKESIKYKYDNQQPSLNLKN